MDEKDIELSVAKALELFEARQAMKAAEEAKFKAEYAKGIEEGKKAGKLETEELLKTWKEQKGSVNLMEKAVLGSGGEKSDTKAFQYWMRTGDMIAAKASLKVVDSEVGQGVDEISRKGLTEGTATAGGVLVPDDVITRIIPKRDKLSFVRQMGVQIINTQSDNIYVPAEGTTLANFSRTAEEGAYTTNDPAFVTNQVIVHKWTKVTRISTELLADDQANLEEWYSNAVARAMAQTEAYYVAIGSGSNQHAGIFEEGTTNGLSFDSSTNITVDEIPELYYTLKSGYRNSQVCWLMNTATWLYLMTLQSTNRLIMDQNMILLAQGDNGAQVGSLMGKRVFCQDNIDTRASAKCVIMVGDPWYYALVERQGLVISRNPYLYEASGQVGFFSTFRQGGKPLVAEAWQGGLMAT